MVTKQKKEQQSILPLKQVSIIADTREAGSEIMDELAKWDCKLILQQLPLADFILSKKVAVERKTCKDFINSIIDGRLFEQVREMVNTFENPILIIEGNNLFGEHPNVPANAVRGALASLVIDFRMPIIFTKDAAETAGFLFWIAKREQAGTKGRVTIRIKQKKMSVKKWQEFIVAGLPGIGTERARRLLRHFKTVENIFLADENALAEVEGIGKITAKRIKEIIKKEYV